MMKMVIGVVALLVLAGCSTYSADRYAISVDNVAALRSLQGQKVSVGEFTSSPKNEKTGADLAEIMCRAANAIKTPDGEPFAGYIKKAMVDEMKMAEIYAPDAATSVSGNLDAIDFSSADGHWNMRLMLTSSNGRSMSLTESYPYTTSFHGETACAQTAQALMPAVQNLVGKAVRSPEFRALVEQ